MADSLQIELLGTLRITIGGEPVAGFVSSKVQALLCYLVVTGRPHFRPTLAALLWGEQSDVEAATNLRQALANLRRLLEPYLLITRQTVAIDRTTLCWLDVERFEAHLAQAQPSIADLSAALELYRGDFLEGFSVRDAPAFEEWALTERERLRELALSALYNLAIQHAARGAYAAGIAASSRLLALDPWREEAHRQLMLLLARSGQRSAALAQYETCRRILAEALGVEPLPETTALYERIRAARVESSPIRLAPTGHLIGRETEQAELAQRLADPACRLLTIVGPGGIGKTRMALQALADHHQGFLHGVCFVALAPIDTVDALLSTLAGALGCPFYPGDDPKAQLFSYLEQKELLLVLDNFEQLIEAGVDLLAELLSRASEIKLLVTSRERLRLRDEWLLELHGLRVPPEATAGAIETSSAAQLFLDRARRVDPGFDIADADVLAIRRICQLVEGMPLGIELAAAWVRTLSCAEIAQEIESSLDFLATTLRDMPERQRSLRAVFDHSLRLLSGEERAVFQRLSVFRGGFGRDAAEQVAGAGLQQLAPLMDKSLLRRTHAGRYELHELVRQYAASRLQGDGESDLMHDRHCAYYAQLLGQLSASLRGSGQQQAVEAIGAEIENVRAGWQWAVTRWNIAALDQSLESLYRFYDIRGWYQEGAAAFEGAIAQLDGAGAPIEAAERQSIVLGRLLGRRSWFCIRLGTYAEADMLLQRSLVLLRSAVVDTRREIALVLVGLGYLVLLKGDYPRARALSHEALMLFQAIKDQHGIADALNNLGIIADVLGEYHKAKQCYQDSLAIHKALGDRRGTARALHNLADTSRLLGEYQAARALHQECLELSRAIGDQMLEAYSLGCLGIVGQVLGDQVEAQRFLQQGLVLYQAIRYKAGIELCHNHLGILACASGDHQEAERQFRAALQLAVELHAVPEILEVLSGLATNLARADAPEQALALLVAIRANPAGYQHTRESVEQLLAELTSSLPPDSVAAALAAEQDQSLEDVIRALHL